MLIEGVKMVEKIKKESVETANPVLQMQRKAFVMPSKTEMIRLLEEGHVISRNSRNKKEKDKREFYLLFSEQTATKQFDIPLELVKAWKKSEKELFDGPFPDKLIFTQIYLEFGKAIETLVKPIDPRFAQNVITEAVNYLNEEIHSARGPLFTVWVHDNIDLAFSKNRLRLEGEES